MKKSGDGISGRIAEAKKEAEKIALELEERVRAREAALEEKQPTLESVRAVLDGPEVRVGVMNEMMNTSAQNGGSAIFLSFYYGTLLWYSTTVLYYVALLQYSPKFYTSLLEIFLDSKPSVRCINNNRYRCFIET